MTEREELATYQAYWENYAERINAMLRNIVVAVL